MMFGLGAPAKTGNDVDNNAIARASMGRVTAIVKSEWGTIGGLELETRSMVVLLSAVQ